MLLTYLWVTKTSVQETAQHLDITEKTTCEWFSFCREVCEEVVFLTKNNKEDINVGLNKNRRSWYSRPNRRIKVWKKKVQ